MSTAITLGQAQAQLAAVLAAQSSNVLTVRYGERMVTYRSTSELVEQVTYWSRMVNELQRVAAGRNRHGVKLANFTGCE